MLSTAWGAAILTIGVSRLVAAVIKDQVSGHTAFQLIFSAVIPVVILIYMMKFSQSYPERVSGARADAGSAGPGATEVRG